MEWDEFIKIVEKERNILRFCGFGGMMRPKAKEKNDPD